MHTATRFPLERVAALDGAIRAGKYPNAGSLARDLEVSRRTVQRDIEFLRDRLGVPLVFDARLNGYTYSHPDYRLPFLPLSQGELIALFLAERVLQQYRGTPYAPDLARAFKKITDGLTKRITIDLGHLGQAHSFRTTAPTPLDPGLFRDLDAANQDRRRVVLRYWAASCEEEARRKVDHYQLASIPEVNLVRTPSRPLPRLARSLGRLTPPGPAWPGHQARGPVKEWRRLPKSPHLPKQRVMSPILRV